MSRMNSIFGAPTPTTKNAAGFPAYNRSLEEQYLQMLLTNTLHNTFYKTSQELVESSWEVHDKMVRKDAPFAAKALVYARNEGFMRLQPIVGLYHLLQHDKVRFAEVFDKVVLIPSDLQDFMTLLHNQGHGEGGRAVRRQVQKFAEKISEYWALKYNSRERSRNYNLGDILFTGHVKPSDTRQNKLFRYLMGKETDLEGLPQIQAAEAFKQATDENERVQLIASGRLPHDLVLGSGNLTRKIWGAVIPQLPLFALLRHLNALERAQVLDTHQDLITARLTNPNAVQSAKIFPFRFLSAFNEVEKTWVKDALRKSIEMSVANLPELEGRIAILLDVSSSMFGPLRYSYSEAKAPLYIAAMQAVSLFKRTNSQVGIIGFNERAFDLPVSQYDSVLTQVERLTSPAALRQYMTSDGTNTGAPLNWLTSKGATVDAIIMITDEQQNSGTRFIQALNTYRQQCNRDVKTFVINVEAYGGSIAPSSDKNIHLLYGWSDEVLRYISFGLKGYGTMVDQIRGA